MWHWTCWHIHGQNVLRGTNRHTSKCSKQHFIRHWIHRKSYYFNFTGVGLSTRKLNYKQPIHSTYPIMRHYLNYMMHRCRELKWVHCYANKSGGQLVAMNSEWEISGKTELVRNVRFGVLREETYKCNAYWKVTPCALVENCGRFIKTWNHSQTGCSCYCGNVGEYSPYCSVILELFDILSEPNFEQ
jgi:hypothetical protein